MLVIGSRGSALALWQARWVKDRLEALGESCRIEIIRTTGDRIQDVPLAKVGAKGLFTKEIEEALLAGTIDVAVHSLKDLPTELPKGLTLAAVPEREDPRDVLLGRSLSELPPRARVGTSSLRRAAQLRAIRPDLDIETIRGNVDTRVRKLDEGRYDAVVLASAGLRRLGLADRIVQWFDPAEMCPAVGQGALAVETRGDGGPAHQACARLDHAETRAAITAERAVLGTLGGGCQVPIGAYAAVQGGRLHLRGIVISPDAARMVKREAEGPADEAAAIGRALAEDLLSGGGREILNAADGTAVSEPGL
jgi:porphobilinogen deaminase